VRADDAGRGGVLRDALAPARCGHGQVARTGTHAPSAPAPADRRAAPQRCAPARGWRAARGARDAVGLAERPELAQRERMLHRLWRRQLARQMRCRRAGCATSACTDPRARAVRRDFAERGSSRAPQFTGELARTESALARLAFGAGA